MTSAENSAKNPIQGEVGRSFGGCHLWCLSKNVWSEYLNAYDTLWIMRMSNKCARLRGWLIGMFDHQRREKGTKLHSITRMIITNMKWPSIVALGHSATCVFPESEIHQSFSTTAELPTTMPQATDPRSNSRILPKSLQNRKKNTQKIKGPDNPAASVFDFARID